MECHLELRSKKSGKWSLFSGVVEWMLVKGRGGNVDILSRRLILKTRSVVVRGRDRGWGKGLWERLNASLGWFGGIFLEKLEDVFSLARALGCHESACFSLEQCRGSPRLFGRQQCVGVKSMESGQIISLRLLICIMESLSPRGLIYIFTIL